MSKMTAMVSLNCWILVQQCSNSTV